MRRRTIEIVAVMLGVSRADAETVVRDVERPPSPPLPPPSVEYAQSAGSDENSTLVATMLGIRKSSASRIVQDVMRAANGTDASCAKGPPPV